jgi:hypothetical protein
MCTPTARANVVGTVEPRAHIPKESRLRVGMMGSASRIPTFSPYNIQNKSPIDARRALRPNEAAAGRRREPVREPARTPGQDRGIENRSRVERRR